MNIAFSGDLARVLAIPSALVRLGLLRSFRSWDICADSDSIGTLRHHRANTVDKAVRVTCQRNSGGWKAGVTQGLCARHFPGRRLLGQNPDLKIATVPLVAISTESGSATEFGGNSGLCHRDSFLNRCCLHGVSSKKALLHYGKIATRLSGLSWSAEPSDWNSDARSPPRVGVSEIRTPPIRDLSSWPSDFRVVGQRIKLGLRPQNEKLRKLSLLPQESVSVYNT